MRVFLYAFILNHPNLYTFSMASITSQVQDMPSGNVTSMPPVI